MDETTDPRDRPDRMEAADAGEAHGEADAPDELDARIVEALRAHAPPPPFPGEAMERAIDERIVEARSRQGAGASATPWRQGPLLRSLLPAAASLLLFVGGSEYGRRMAMNGTDAARPAGPAAAPAALQSGTVGAISLPLTIQSAGGNYVASLARFTEAAQELPEAEREIAREVAYAVIYSAALQLLQESGDDDLLAQIAELVAQRRNQFDGGRPSPASF